MTDSNDVTVVIPTIPPRRHHLSKALGSVGAQQLLPTDVVVQDDFTGAGAGPTRHAGLMRVRTPWVAFLDDDDLLYPQHLVTLRSAALHHSADYVWSYFDLLVPGVGMRNEGDPLGHFGKQWDDDAPIQTTIVTLVRTELAQAVGFLHVDENGLIAGQRAGEDFAFTLGCRAAGAAMLHVPERTWVWQHWGGNLSGLPWREAPQLEIINRQSNGGWDGQ